MGSFVNKIYYTLKAPPGLTANDPAWIGAWWLGFLIIGIILIFPSFAVFFFPSGKNKKVYLLILPYYSLFRSIPVPRKLSSFSTSTRRRPSNTQVSGKRPQVSPLVGTITANL